MSAISMRRYLTHVQVAEALGVNPEWFYRNKRRLEREEGFPRPASGMGKLYDPAAIALWQDRQLGGPAAPPPPAPAPQSMAVDGDDDQKVTDLILERARRIAARGHAQKQETSR